MSIRVRVVTNVDDACIAWQATSAIAGCRGFALEREIRAADHSTKTSFVETWVGFATEDAPYAHGAHKPSTEWPVQRYLWTDYFARDCTAVRYRVIPMVGTAASLSKADEAEWSPWSDWGAVRTGQTSGYDAYFNRGIVASQWLARRLGEVPPSEQKRKLKDVIADPSSQIRQFLAGEARIGLKGVFERAASSGQKLYAALYELNDPELQELIEAAGPRIELIISNGTHKNAEDENAKARAALESAGTTVHDRMVTGAHLAHNKFVVICDAADRPEQVWTGSLNWTQTGLCTQANNGLLVRDAALAGAYKLYWDRLRDAGDGYDGLAKENSSPVSFPVGSTSASPWFAPVQKGVDLDAARALIQGAKQGVLFLMFVPGPKGTLLNDILDLRDQNLFVHGVVNQDVGHLVSEQEPQIALVDRGTQVKVDPKVILPSAVNETLQYWIPELRQFSIAMIHSKVIVVDPFGEHPVVMTGSHNMGPKASSKNDDNLLIIENCPGLAGEYAVNIMGIYGQYKYRYNQMQAEANQGAAALRRAAGGVVSAKWQGLEDSDTWQARYLSGPRADELRFWFGEAPESVRPDNTARGSAGSATKSVKTARPNKSGKKAVAKKTAKKRAVKKPVRRSAPKKSAPRKGAKKGAKKSAKKGAKKSAKKGAKKGANKSAANNR